MSTQSQILSYCELFRKMFCPKTPVVFGFHAFVQAQPNTILLGSFLKVLNVLSKITGHDWMHFAMLFIYVPFLTLIFSYRLQISVSSIASPPILSLAFLFFHCLSLVSLVYSSFVFSFNSFSFIMSFRRSSDG